MVPFDLETLLPVDPAPPDALDLFVSTCLFEGGVWDDPRTSDGIPGIARVLEHAPDRLRLRAQIYEIDDQSLHWFWLELERDAPGYRVTWHLYFDVVASSPRKARNAIDTYERAEDIEWRVRLAGEAEVRDGALTVVPGSARVVVPDETSTSW